MVGSRGWVRAGGARARAVLFLWSLVARVTKEFAPGRAAFFEDVVIELDLVRRIIEEDSEGVAWDRARDPVFAAHAKLLSAARGVLAGEDRAGEALCRAAIECWDLLEVERRTAGAAAGAAAAAARE